jgi:hypothetical protein
VADLFVQTGTFKGSTGSYLESHPAVLDRKAVGEALRRLAREIEESRYDYAELTTFHLHIWHKGGRFDLKLANNRTGNCGGGDE